jgi:stage II sporulation protein M
VDGQRLVKPQSWGARLWREVRLRIERNLQIVSFLVGVTICGIVFGAVVAGQLSSGDSIILGRELQNLIQAVTSRQLAPADELFWQRMIGDGQLLALIWLFGVSVIGMPFVVVAIFLRAFSIGFSVGFTVIQFGWKGVMLASTAIFLHQLIAMTVFIVSAVFAIKFSAGILRQVYPLPKLSVHFLKYTAVFVLSSGGLMVGAAIQAYLAPSLLFRAFS